MATQRRTEASRPTSPRSRKRKGSNLLRRLIGDRMACVLMLAIAVTFILSVYVSAYAKATETGYQRSELVSQLKALNLENESLRLQLEELRQPERIAAYAESHGMEPGERMAFVKPAQQPQVAHNPE